MEDDLITINADEILKGIPDGDGPFLPVSSNETEDGRKLNRRVELVAK